MDGIRKYTKEWFTLKGTEEQFKDAQSLGGKKSTQGGTTINGNIFEGSLDDAKANFEKMRSQIKNMPPSTYYQVNNYGLENIFNALDADKDGIVTQDEIQAVAALSTPEGQDDDTVLSAEDLNILYENAMAAVNSSVEQDGDEMNFSYTDGSKISLTTDKDGNIIRRSETTINEDGSKTVKNSNKRNNSSIVSNYDEKGRLVSKDEDYEGQLKDKTTTYTYADDGSKTQTIDTIGKTVVTQYGKDGKVSSKNTTVKYDSDGVIGNTSQGDINDCWVLSGVNALSYSEKGREILNKAVTHNDDGSVTVKLVGGGKEYTFSAEEIALNKYENGEKEYSSGDTDMNIIEMAFAKYRKENVQNKEASIYLFDRAHNKSIGTTESDPLNNGMTDEAVYLLTGTKAEYWLNPRVINLNGIGEKLLNKFQKNPEDYAMVCSFKGVDESITDGAIKNRHVYSIKSVDDENVYVVNPWDTTKTITYPKDKFMANINDISLTDLEEATTAKKLDSEKFGSKVQEKISHGLGKVDYALRPTVSAGIDKAKEVYSDGKEIVEDTVDKAKDLWAKFKNRF